MLSYSDLPEEIILDILSRLPAKYVGRCRCVSKPWRALLSEPKFIRTHLHRSRNLGEESLIFISYERSLFSASLSSAHHLFDKITIPATKLNFAVRCWTWVYASCDGLLLVEAIRDIFVLNPVTRQIRKVPPSPFALDPRKSFIRYGFGYDSVNDDYKIVTLSDYNTGNEHEPDSTEMFVNVYSLKNGCWKRAQSSPYDHVGCHIISGGSVNGCIHWVANRTTDYKSVIVAFDLVEEKFQEVTLPSSADKDNFVVNLLVMLGGCLCMFNIDETDVWMMKEYGVQESWTKFKIDDPEIEDNRPLCLSGQEEVVLMKDEEKLMMYNLKEGTLKDIVIDAIEDDLHAELSFIESLVSPHGANETVGE